VGVTSNGSRQKVHRQKVIGRKVNVKGSRQMVHDRRFMTECSQTSGLKQKLN